MAQYLKVRIEQIRGIKTLEIELNLSPGIYAITGQNASGKSTLMASLASIFYRDLAKRYFIKSTNENTKILVSLNRKTLEITPDFPTWKYLYDPDNGRLKINGFYEGSIIHGNRFRDTNTKALFEASKIIRDELEIAANFVWMNLGLILHNNQSYYENRLFQ